MPRRPFVTLKYAQTLDGRVASSTGHSRWVSGPQSRVLAHRLRAEHDAVLVGIGTVLADDPQLTVRLWEGPDPLRVVVDSRLRIPLEARVIQAGPKRTLVVTSSAASTRRVAALEAVGVRVLSVAAEERRVNLSALLRALQKLGIQTVLVEGGAGISTSFLRERLVDALVIVVAPKILGTGLDAVGDLGATMMDQAIRVVDMTVEPSGDDFVVRGRPVWPNA
jgi:riboflavin-specific deaminase-like protein